jgi:hypothetical protein
VFIACSHCWCTKGTITPIRIGQSMRRNNCWHVIRWTPHGDVTGHVDCRRARGLIYQDIISRGKKPKNVGKRSMASRIRRACDVPTRKHRYKWETGLLSKDDRLLQHGLAWSAAGGTYGYPKPYQVCPWDSDNSPEPGFAWDDLFPGNFEFLVRQFVNKPGRKEYQIHSRGYYDAIWKCMCDAIRRDPELLRCPKVEDYVENVIKKTMWWEQIGWERYDTVTTNDACFSLNDPLDYEIPTPTSKREGAIQPQATGQRNRSNVGSGCASFFFWWARFGATNAEQDCARKS